MIRSLTPSGPAKRSGKLFPGDIIVKVNDVNMLQQPLQLCHSIITGPPASVVKFTIQRYVAGVALPLQHVFITRDMPSIAVSTSKPYQNVKGTQSMLCASTVHVLVFFF
jgi:C-terminal processing protease CtpA/Prc